MHTRHVRIKVIAVVIALFGMVALPVTVGALTVPAKPTDIPVVDQTNTLTAEQKTALATKIANERKATGNQIAVLMIPSLEGDSLENYSLNVAREWGIGQKERNSGVLLLVVKDDRRLRIEVGYGLEGALPDIRANQIIRDRIKPAFTKNDYFGGINAGVDGIITAIHGEADPSLSQDTNNNTNDNFPWEFILFFGLMGFSWLGSVLGRTKSWWAGGIVGGIIGAIIGFIFGFLFIGIISVVALTLLGLLFDKIVSANYRSHASHGDAPSWWAGGPFIGGGGGSGGGFGGFGGGGFGGGGASGDW
jgi:uncharacterized protein